MSAFLSYTHSTNTLKKDMKIKPLPLSLLCASLLCFSSAYALDFYVVVPVKNRTSAAQVSLTPATPSSGIVGQPYVYDFKPHLVVTNDSFFNGSGVTWAITGGALPQGLSLSEDGVVSGTPTAAGSRDTTLRATYKAKLGSQTYTFTIATMGSQAYTSPGTYTFTVPDGIESISALAIGGGGSGGNGGDTYCNGGASGGDSSFGSWVVAGGGVGAPSSSRAGGAGGSVKAGIGNAGGSGVSGGGGAGGYSGKGGAGSASGWGYSSGAGGGVGLYGEGASGAGGASVGSGPGSPGTGGAGGGGSGGSGYGGNGKGGGGGSNGADGANANAVGGVGGAYGGGGGGSSWCGGGGGGALAYANNIAVTPGQKITVTVGAPGATFSSGGAGAVRIVWPGSIRQFPSTNVSTN